MINPFWWHKFGKGVVEKINEVRRIQHRGFFDEVAEDWPQRPPMKEVPEELAQQSTSKETLEKIAQALGDEENSVMCVYGMGGIGKTTLMKALYNRLIEEEEINGKKKFDQVIWVTVSRDLNLQAIQCEIGNKLKVEFRGNEGMEERRDLLYARLRNLRFMLIFDDVWQAIPLDLVGIPQPDKRNRCKIAVTTRSLEVSRNMEADAEIKVKALSREEAWDLFRSKTGDVVLPRDIRLLAELVVEECGRLPLAIKTVGAAMRGKDKKNLWRDALRSLRKSVPEVLGMERQVFLPLKLSYDYLEDPKTQLCFLHCSFFPEDHIIDPNDLVRHWAFEQGLIENVSTLDEALNKGYDILERLKNASLLEVSSKDLVRMHDLLRDLAIWISSPSSSLPPYSSSSTQQQVSKFLVRSGEGLEHPPEEKSWEGVEKVSLMNNAIKELEIKPNCPNLVSLFLCENWQLNVIYSRFFHQMPRLGILDLGKTGIRSLPPSLNQLVSLRALILNKCKRLVHIPPLGALKELQLLDLSFSGIEELPEGIPNLSKLKQLDLSYTKALADIECDFISSLTSLEDLRLWGRDQMRVAAWREVATLRRLTCLSINLSKLDDFGEHDLHHDDHQWLSNLVQFRLSFGGCFFDSCDPFTQTERDLRIWFCCNFPKGIQRVASHAQYLQVLHCQGPACVSQIISSSKSLKTIDVTFSEEVKCIIDWKELDDHANSLDCLEKLVIYSLPSLEKIFEGRPPPPPLAPPTYSSQQLKEVYISKCPKLKIVFSCSMVGHLDQLRQLKVEDCVELGEIVQGETLPDNALQRLSSLKISSLPKLTSICRQLPVLNSLKAIRLEGCPELKKLPVLGSAITKIEGKIKGQREWWEGMEWEDGCHSKSLYYSVYKEGSCLDRFGRGGRLSRLTDEEGEGSDIEE